MRSLKHILLGGMLVVWTVATGCGSPSSPATVPASQPTADTPPATKPESKPARKTPVASPSAEPPQPATPEHASPPDSILSLIPQDAYSALILHPQKATATPLGKALLQLHMIPPRLQRSAIAAADVQQVIFAKGSSTDQPEDECTIVRFAKPMSKELLLKEEFGDQPYEQVSFQGSVYYRYSSDLIDSVGDGSKDIPSVKSELIASYPEDFRENENGHLDGSGQGNWYYMGSDSNAATPQQSSLKPLTWDPVKNRYQHSKRGKNNVFPSIGETLHPSPDQPYYPLLRWQSRIAAKVRIRGKFSKLADAKNSDGVRAFINVDSDNQFAEDIGPRDTVGAEFDVTTTIHPGSEVDFVIGAKKNAEWDATKLVVSIEKVMPDEEAMPIPVVSNDGDLKGSGIWLVDDWTTVHGNEHQLRSLIDKRTTATPLTMKLQELDLNHDLMVVVVTAGHENEIAAISEQFTDETGVPLEGVWATMPGEIEWVVISADLSGDTLLDARASTKSDASANELHAAMDSLLESAEGLRRLLPLDSPALPVLKQLLQGTSLQLSATSVQLSTKMPDSLFEFVEQDGIRSLASIDNGMPQPTGEEIPEERPQPSTLAPTQVARRTMPDEFSKEFEDLILREFDCRVFFPKNPAPPLYTTAPVTGGEVEVVTYDGNSNNATYLFEVYTYPQDFVDQMSASKLALRTRDSMVDSPTGRLRSGNPANYDGGEAIDFIYEHPATLFDGKGHVRVIVRGNRVYVLQADGVDVPPKEIAFFHNSFAPFDVPGSVPRESTMPPQAPKEKQPLPAVADRETALELVRKLYQEDFQNARTAIEKVAVAQTMLDRAADSKEPAERFVLLDVARKTAAGTGGVQVALEAVAQLEDQFQLNALQLKTQTLLALAEGTLTTDDRAFLSQEMVTTARDAIAADQFDAVKAMLDKAAANARLAKDFKLAKSAAELLTEAAEIETYFAAIRPALAKLPVSPDDSAANLAVGQYRCFYQGDWDLGLPLLAKGSDADLKSLAAEDLSRPDSADQQIALGDRWFQRSTEADATVQKHQQLRAAFWYRKALPGLSGLEKDAVEKQLAEMKYVAEASGPQLVHLPDVKMLGADVLINDGKGNFREERFRGEIYPEVLWAHAKDDTPSHYAFELNRQYSEISGKAAINDVQSSARPYKPQVFAIYGDRRLLWKSDPMQENKATQPFRLNVSGVKVLHLYVSGGGFGGHALWMDVVLEKK